MTVAGPMRCTILFQRRTTLQVGTGEPRTEWLDVGARYAEKLATPGEVIWSGRERSARVPTVFKIRYPREVDITPDLRVIYDGRLYDISSVVDPTGRKEDLLVSCSELVGEPATL